MTNTNHDTYEQALKAVMAALDVLHDDAFRASTAFDPGAEDYQHSQHLIAAGRMTGVADALAVVTGMLADYRAARAGAA